MKVLFTKTAIVLICASTVLSSCSKHQQSDKTGMAYNDKNNGGYEKFRQTHPSPGPGLIPIEGGTFVVGGSADQDVTYTWTEATAPVFSNLPTGGYLGCNPTRPTCSTTVTASNECGDVAVTCTPGTVTHNGCNYSRTFHYHAHTAELITDASSPCDVFRTKSSRIACISASSFASS